MLTRNVTVLAVLFITFSSAICHAQEYADWIGSVPQPLKVLRFGMPVSEVQKVIPEAKAVDATSAEPAVFAVFFTAPEVWDAAALHFAAGKFVAIDLVLMHNGAEYLPRSQQRLAETLAKNGDGYTRLVTLNSAREPMPAYVWERGDFRLLVKGPSAGTSRSGKQIFSVDPQFRVSVAPKTRPLSEMVPVASPAQMIDFLFTLLSPVEEK